MPLGTEAYNCTTSLPGAAPVFFTGTRTVTWVPSTTAWGWPREKVVYPRP